jgi:D-lactate dehydrogenase
MLIISQKYKCGGNVADTKIVFFETEDWAKDYLSKQGLDGGNVKFYSDPLNEDTAKLAEDADVVSFFIYSRVDKTILDKLPNVKLVTTRSTGYDHIDTSACRERGVVACNVPRYGENTVAEHAFGLILSLSRNIYHAYFHTSRLDFHLTGLRGFDLKDKTIGVVGAGAIGLHVIRIAKGFGMKVLAFDTRPQPLISEVLGFEYVPLNELLQKSDIISLHTPLNEHTHHLINEESIKLIKRGAILINTARGGVVDTGALVKALNEGIIAGAGLDVLEGEETIKEEAQLLSQDTPVEKLRALVHSYALLHRDNVIITPHMAFYSVEAEERILDTTVENIQGFLEGKPVNVVG